MNDNQRAIAKTLTWRVIASLTTFFLAWGISGNAKVGLAVGSSEAVLKMFFYYFHERAWQKYAPLKS